MSIYLLIFIALLAAGAALYLFSISPRRSRLQEMGRFM